VALRQCRGHAVEGFGQLTDLVAARQLDPMFVLARAQHQHAFVHRGNGSQQVSRHPPAEVSRDDDREREEDCRRPHERPLERSLVGQSFAHGIQ
jgi:hypothetical protein